MFGPIADTTEGLIRKVQVDYHTNTNRVTSTREMRYTATPKATVDYNQDNVIDAADDPFVDPDDDFGFNETFIDYTDSKSFSPTRKEDI